ncbi:M23 family metallopeptidase [Bacteroidota bacterium]
MYVYNLKKANLQNSILFKKFIQASEKALLEALVVPIPYSEIFYIDHSIPDAIGYRFAVKKGQKIKIETELYSLDSVQLFIDVFRIKDSLNTDWYHVASANKDSLYLEFIARRNAQYIVRVQPELLCDVQCKVVIEKESSLLFPVIGRDKNSIQSFFGDPREGGKRKHHGVDIFASRHTKVIASEDGYVSRKGNRGIGGKHVRIYYPSLGIYCYYAHLETLNVVTGSKIKTGSLIGTVGNSGNARYTPPHLHFGIYQSGLGAIDPYYYIATENEKSRKISNRLNLLGSSVRTNMPDIKLLVKNEYLKLPKNANLQVCAINTSKVRVILPNGIIGFIDIENIEGLNKSRKQGRSS